MDQHRLTQGKLDFLDRGVRSSMSSNGGRGIVFLLRMLLESNDLMILDVTSDEGKTFSINGDRDGFSIFVH